MNTRLRNLEQRAAALLPPEPWTFEEFRAAWASADGLCRSLYETMAATPELFPSADCGRIADYLRRLGVETEPQPFNMEALEGDTI